MMPRPATVKALNAGSRNLCHPILNNRQIDVADVARCADDTKCNQPEASKGPLLAVVRICLRHDHSTELERSVRPNDFFVYWDAYGYIPGRLGLPAALLVRLRSQIPHDAAG